MQQLKCYILFLLADNEFKEPASILYVLMYLAQHYSYLGNTSEALNLIQAALEHTPTLIELYILKGKILKVSNLCSVFILRFKIVLCALF